MNNYGIIYDIKGDKAVVLTENSNFVMIRRREDMFLGQKVAFGDEDICKVRKKYYRYVSVAASLAAVCALIFVFLRMIPGNADIYGYVAVDINPSLEFAIDKNYEVVEAVAFNDYGKDLIDNMDVLHRPVETVILEVIKESKNRGYINAGEKTDVLISASFKNVNNEAGSPDGSGSSEIDKLLDDIEKEIEGYDINIDGIMVKLAYEAREAARKHDISMGRYDLYLKLNNIKKAVTIDEVNAMKVSDLLKIIDGKDYEWSARDEENVQKEPDTEIEPDDEADTSEIQENNATATPIYTPVKSPSNDSDIKTSISPSPVLPNDKISQSKEDGQKNSSSNPSKGSESQSNSTGNKILKLKHYNREQSGEKRDIRWDFVLENTGKDTIDLRNVKVRYYFKDDFWGKFNFLVYYYSLGDEKTDVKGRIFSPVKSDSSKRYLEVTFEKGSISPGESAWVFGAISREDWTEFNKEDDWSFLQGGSDFSEWDKMTVYVSDKLVWGIEPY